MVSTNTKKQVRTKQPKPKSSHVEGKDEEDRISNLSEGLLLHILSFLDTRSAFQTSLVSRTWKNLWLSLDTLRLNYRNCSDFAAQVLHRLGPSASHIRHLRYHATCPLDTRRCPDQKSPTLSRVLKFAADRNCRSFELGYVAFACLDIASFLPNVTTLHLDHVVFRKGLEVSDLNVFSNCPNLKDLSLISCFVDSSKTFEISCPKLMKLRIEHPFMYHTCYSLKCKLVVSSPELRNLEIVDISPFPLTLVGSDSLHIVSFSVNLCYGDDREIEGMMKMLQELRGVKHLELSMLVLQGLSGCPELLRKQTFGFDSLESLKLRANMSCCNSKLPNHVMKFFLGISPSAKVTFPKLSKLRASPVAAG